MLTLPPSVRIYLAVEPVDLRRGHDGLGAIVRGQWGENLFAGHLFVFLGRRRDRCKILFWDRGGLPRVTTDGRSIEMDATELMMLLDGIDVRYVRRAEHWKPEQKETA